MPKRHEIKPDDRAKLTWMFADCRENFILDSILEGHLGTAVVDDEVEPGIAQLSFADVVIFGGDSTCPAALGLAESLPRDKAVLPSAGGWFELLHDVHGGAVSRFKRIGFSCEGLNLERLKVLAGRLPAGHCLRRIDLDLACKIDADRNLISEDHVHNFESPEDFVRRGVGFCVLSGGRVVSGASSYAFCRKGIEVQVNTHPDYRSRGLATAVSAALLAFCLEHGIEPHWDANNEHSVRLAEKLGYAKSDEYEILVLE